MAGFEPAASCSQSRRANQAALHPARPGACTRPIRSLPLRRPGPGAASVPAPAREPPAAGHSPAKWAA